MRLTIEIKFEMMTMRKRIFELKDKYYYSARLDPSTYHTASSQIRQNLLRGGEIELFKVKLENFYSETDMKEELMTAVGYFIKDNVLID